MRETAYVRLTPDRVKILRAWLTALEANIETGEGDFWAVIEGSKDEDVKAALRWLNDIVQRKAEQFVRLDQ